MNEKARQNEQQLIENLNRDHAKVCDKLKVEYEQAKEQFVVHLNPTQKLNSFIFKSFF